MATDNYYYTVNGSPAQGPEPLKTLQTMRESGMLAGAVMVAREGDQEWVPIEATMRDIKPITNAKKQLLKSEHSTSITKTQGYILIGLLVLGALFCGYTYVEGKKATITAANLQSEIAKNLANVVSIQNEASKTLNDANALLKENSANLTAIHASIAPVKSWEYCTISFTSEGESRTGSGAMKFATIDYKDAEVSKLGSAGWELVSCYLEMETAYPNFGKDEYVTGLQPNVRPQKLVLIFRRPALGGKPGLAN